MFACIGYTAVDLADKKELPKPHDLFRDTSEQIDIDLQNTPTQTKKKRKEKIMAKKTKN